MKNFGAKGDGKANDTKAINAAIAAAATGDTVEFPSGTYVAASLHLKSSLTLHLDAGSVIQAASSGFDPPEANAFDQFQDFGHSHFHDALIWGEDLHDITIAGTGTIDGNGNLVRSNTVPSGQADKALSLRSIDHLTITDITIRHGGHFGILANGCTNVTVARVKVLTSTDRDAFNLINSSHVQISDSQIEGSDDAMVLKSDFALGRKIASSDIHVTNSRILSTQNNALQFGSETCGDFSNVSFSGITITAAGKAGIGITSNDGAIIDGVTYDNITMSGTTTPIFLKLDDQGRCPGHPPLGRIRNIRITNVTATHSIDARSLEFTSAISGKPGVPIENVTLQNVKLFVPGNHPTSDASVVPPENDDWTPKSLGVRPSFGWYLRHVRNINFVGGEMHFDASNDGRPGFIAEDGQVVTLDSCIVERGSNSAFDIGFTGVIAGTATGCVDTHGRAARVHTSP